MGAGGGDATQGGKLATEEAGAGFVLLPRSLTGPRLPPRRGYGGGRSELVRGGGRTPAGGVGSRRRAVPAVGGRRAARLVYEHRCPRALGRWQLGAFSRRRASRGAPRNRPTLRGRPLPPPRPWALSGASSEPFTCQVPGKWKPPVLDVIGERRRACWRKKMRFP